MDRRRPIPLPARRPLRPLAGRRALASQVLPDLRIAARDGQLVGVDPGRQRFLVCGGCGTRWRYRRTQCPFCENDSQRLAVLGVEGEAGLRIDYCEACKGYLKTYDGQGDEAVLLADWTSLHLDVLAHDRGLERLATSLYDLGSLRAPA